MMNALKNVKKNARTPLRQQVWLRTYVRTIS